MLRPLKFLLAGLALALIFLTHVAPGFAQGAEPRLALVIGNAQYRSAPLATPANDAGLVAQTLQSAGFDVTGAADLDQAGMRQAFRDFIDKVRGAGPGAVVFVYLSGRGVQYAGENYFVPVDATIARDTDVPVEALRLADYTQALAGLPLKARIFVLDAARANNYAKSGPPLAGGLALVDAEPGSLYAFNAAPGTIAPDERGPYGAYAQALVEMMHQGFAVNEVFAQTRLRVNQLSGGALVPWDVSRIEAPILFFQREAGAPPLRTPASLNRPLHDYPVQEAYAVALDRDTISGYQDFLTAYPRDPLALRVRALLAARREALTWRRALDANTPAAYWTYMRRYPHGPHYFDARRRLAFLTAPLDPPPRFDPYDFEDLAPPPETDYEIVDRPELIFENPDYPPPPPPPVYILPERPPEFVRLPPPPPPRERGILPIPAPVPVPFSRPATRAPGVINQPRFGQGQQPQPPQQQPQGEPPRGRQPVPPPPGQQPPAGRQPEPGTPPQGHELPKPGQQPPADHQPEPGTPPQGHELPKPGQQPPAGRQPEPGTPQGHELPKPGQQPPAGRQPEPGTPPPGHELPKPGQQPPAGRQPEPGTPQGHELPKPGQQPPAGRQPEPGTPPQGHELPKPGQQPLPHPVPERAVPAHPAPERAAPEHAAPPQHPAPEHAAPVHPVPEHTAPERAAPPPPPPHPAPERAAPERAAPPHPVPERPAPERAAPPPPPPHPVPPPPPHPVPPPPPPHPAPPPPHPPERAAPPPPHPAPPPKKEEHRPEEQK